MSIDLTGDPAWPGWPVRRGSPLPIVKAAVMPFRLGGVVRGALGGSQIINRLGDRWQMAIETATLDWEPEGRRWASLIERAEREGGLFRLPQPGTRLYSAGAVTVAAATAAGRSLPVTGLTPGAVVLAGQWLSIIVAGRRYADKVTAQAVASSGGAATLGLANLLRAPVPAGSVVELAVPKIEGAIDVSGGEIALDGTVSWSITVIEDV